MTTFNNHAPINFDNSKIIASSKTDGGVYDGIGYDRLIIEQGKMLHFYSEYSSGCSYNNRTNSSTHYIFGCRTKEEMIVYLLEQIGKGEVNIKRYGTLLGDLGYTGTEA